VSSSDSSCIPWLIEDISTAFDLDKIKPQAANNLDLASLYFVFVYKTNFCHRQRRVKKKTIVNNNKIK